MAASRACTVCGIEKPLTDFSPHPRGKYGKQPRCKRCCTVANSARYHAHIETARKKSLERYKVYCEKYPERRKEQRKRWNDAHPEKAKAVRDAWRKANPEKQRNANAAWHARNRTLSLEYAERWRARGRVAPGKCSASQIAGRVAMFGGRCWVPGCGVQYEAIDHVIPLSRGGSNWPANLRPICRRHNGVKGSRHWSRMVA